MYKIVVAGCRDFVDYNHLKSCLDPQIAQLIVENNILDEIEIVSGGARGADSLGERYAREWNFALKRFPADWNQYGKRAGYIRNEQMAKYADACICFWDGQSKGTKHMIDLARKYNLKLIVNRIDNNKEE